MPSIFEKNTIKQPYLKKQKKTKQELESFGSEIPTLQSLSSHWPLQANDIKAIKLN